MNIPKTYQEYLQGRGLAVGTLHYYKIASAIRHQSGDSLDLIQGIKSTLNDRHGYDIGDLDKNSRDRDDPLYKNIQALHRNLISICQSCYPSELPFDRTPERDIQTIDNIQEFIHQVCSIVLPSGTRKEVSGDKLSIKTLPGLLFYCSAELLTNAYENASADNSSDITVNVLEEEPFGCNIRINGLYTKKQLKFILSNLQQDSPLPGKTTKTSGSIPRGYGLLIANDIANSFGGIIKAETRGKSLSMIISVPPF